jgi:hypothetical protein
MRICLIEGPNFEAIDYNLCRSLTFRLVFGDYYASISFIRMVPVI